MNKKSLLLIGAILALGLYGFSSLKKEWDKPQETIPQTDAINVFAGYAIGDEAADFNLRNIDGKKVSLSNYSNAKGFIVVFTCNHCPFSKAYEDRLVALHTKFASQGYPVVAINPNDPEAYEEDSFENMKMRAAEKGFTFPYLEDTQGIGQVYGASRTPHVFVLKKESDKRIVKYIGAVDDNAQDASAVGKKYVEDAVNNLLGNKPVVIQTTKAIGCSIKWRSNS